MLTWVFEFDLESLLEGLPVLLTSVVVLLELHDRRGILQFTPVFFTLNADALTLQMFVSLFDHGLLKKVVCYVFRIDLGSRFFALEVGVDLLLCLAVVRGRELVGKVVLQAAKGRLYNLRQ